jgi:hypothetical protein
MAHSNYTASFGNSGRQAYGSDRSSLAPRTLQHSAQFGRSLVTHISTWIGVSIVAWGLLPPDVQQMLTGKSWPSSIDEKWPFLLGAALLTWSCFRAWSGQSALAEQVTDSPLSRITTPPNRHWFASMWLRACRAHRGVQSRLRQSGYQLATARRRQ